MVSVTELPEHSPLMLVSITLTSTLTHAPPIGNKFNKLWLSLLPSHKQVETMPGLIIVEDLSDLVPPRVAETTKEDLAATLAHIKEAADFFSQVCQK